jgi:hypothetical protein
MKFFTGGVLALAAAGSVAFSCPAQTAPAAAPQAPQSTPQAQPSQDQPSQGQPPKGQVIFSRSLDENGKTVTHTGSAPGVPVIQTVAAPTAEDAERQAVTFTDFDLDVRLRLAEHHFAARASVTVRNDGKTPLTRIPLQISSTLNWERIRVNLRDVAFTVATLNSDSDHTGQLHEAAVLLGKPLAPGGLVQLDVTYSGEIDRSAQRLVAIGTPDDVAQHSDWDRIDAPFTGLRGFGNVVWYPVSSVPVILGDGARLFDEMGEHKLRLAGAHFRLRLTVEYPAGQAPTVALINGHPAPLTSTNPPEGAAVDGVATASLEGATLGFEAPSLFIASLTPHTGVNMTVWAMPEHEQAVQAWSAAAATVTPFLQGWLGQRPRSQLTILDLPDALDASFETGALLVTPVREAGPELLDGILAHALTHAWMQSPRAWLSEGVAHFMGTLWVEKELGRGKALEALESARGSLALGELESPGQGEGQPLAQAISPAYYRTKAAYVLWMLRDVAGDATLSAALRAYDPAADLGRDTGRSSFEKLLEQAGSRRDLAWFFADWVDADKGLPDLSIESVFPTAQAENNWLVTVNLANSGYASAEVPVIVRSETHSVTQRMLVPAHSKAVLRILVVGKPVEVQANDGVIPETQASVHVTRLEGPTGTSPSSGPTNPR